jgi:hypothetical protein
VKQVEFGEDCQKINVKKEIFYHKEFKFSGAKSKQGNLW